MTISLLRSIEKLQAAQKMIDECPPTMLPGNAMVEIGDTIESLQDTISELRAPSSHRYQVTFSKWYKNEEPKIFHRWDNAIQYAIKRMFCHYTHFNIRTEPLESKNPDEEIDYIVVSKDKSSKLVISKVRNRQEKQS